MSRSFLYHALGNWSYKYVRTEYDDHHMIFTSQQEVETYRRCCYGSKECYLWGPSQRPFLSVIKIIDSVPVTIIDRMPSTCRGRFAIGIGTFRGLSGGA